MHTLPPPSEMEHAVQSGDATYDGLFVVAVILLFVFDGILSLCAGALGRLGSVA